MTGETDPSPAARWTAGRSFEGEFRVGHARVRELDPRQLDVGSRELEPRELEPRELEPRELELEYNDWGDRDRPAVLLVHGFNVQAHTWDPIASVLSERYRVITPDLRGHGGSDWTRRGYWIEQFASDLIQLMDLLEVPRYAIAGHSLGARVAIAIAGMRPDASVGVVLSDTGPEVLTGGARRASAVGAARLDRRGFASRAEALEHYRQTFPEWAPAFHELHAKYQLRENWAAKFVDRSDPDLFWIARSAGRRDDPVLWRHSAAIEAPVLMMYGATSEYTDAPLVARFAEVFKDFRAIELPCGHYLPRELPSEFCRHLLEFLEQTWGPS